MLTEAEQKELDGLRQFVSPSDAFTHRLVDLERKDASQRVFKGEPTIAAAPGEFSFEAPDFDDDPTLERIPNLRTCGVARANGR